MSFQLFNRLNMKDTEFSQKDLFMKQLMQIQSLGYDKAIAIVEVYPTLTRFLHFSFFFFFFFFTDKYFSI